MRTTLTLDPDVAQQIRERMVNRNLSLKTVVNEALRAGLAKTRNRAKAPLFKVEPHSFGFRPGIDPHKLNQLADELEAEEFLRKR